MRTPAVFCIGLLILAVSAAGMQRAEPEPPQIIEEFMTFDLRIQEGLPVEYAIEWPRDVCTNEAGDIHVVEADQIKVFDRDGNPKRLCGKPGTDPGEFDNLHYLTISESGHMVAGGGQFGFTFQVFGPDYELIRKLVYMRDPPYQIQMDDLELHPDRPRDIVAYSPGEFFYYLMGRGSEEENRYDHTHMLIHEKDDECKIFASYEGHSYIHGGTMGTILPFLGYLHYTALPGKRIVFSHGEYDRTAEEDRHSYIINIMSLEDGSVTKITRSYEPVPVVEEDFSFITGLIERSQNERQKQAFQEAYADAQGKTEGIEFKVPLTRIISDREYVFAFTYTQDDSLGTFTDIFDADSGRYLHSAWVQTGDQEMGNLQTIERGYAFYLKRSREEGESSVTRYRVNPAVYRK